MSRKTTIASALLPAAFTNRKEPVAIVAGAKTYAQAAVALLPIPCCARV